MRLALPALLLVACGGGGGGGPNVPPSAGDAVLNYAAIVRATYEDAHAGATDLDAALRALVAAPSEATLEAARDAWRAAREPYLQTEVFRFYEGPIDNPVDGPETSINAWPMDEVYIDYVVGMPDAGIINDPDGYPDLGADAIAAVNLQGGEENIATGYHPIEFLLWGQDLSETGPGDRPFTDYVTGGSGTAENQDRRGEYLLSTSELLLRDLAQVRDAWAPSTPGNYRAQLEISSPAESIRKLLIGLLVLTGFETGSERIVPALMTGDQEDEHSCFSDNSHRDFVQDIVGMQNVYEGRYRRLDGSMVSGRSVHDVLAEVDPALADRLRAEIEASLAAAEALVPPFDREISPDNPAGNARAQAVVTALRAQEQTLLDVFAAFRITAQVPAR